MAYIVAVTEREREILCNAIAICDQVARSQWSNLRPSEGEGREAATLLHDMLIKSDLRSTQ